MPDTLSGNSPNDCGAIKQRNAADPRNAVELKAIVTWLDEQLDLRAFPDESVNGLQVEGGQLVRTIGAAVDSGESVILQAAEKGVDLLLVHHGLLWGQNEPICGAFGRKVGVLIKNSMSLYAAHLPLDGHIQFGNNAIIAQMLELGSTRPALKYRGANIGIVGTNSAKLDREQIAARLASLGGYGPGTESNHGGVLVLPFGPAVPQNIAVLSGSGCSAIGEAAKEGFDTLVTGEPKQSAYHHSREAGINLICAGHYATETVGVAELARIVADRFKIGQIFLDCPTGI